MIRTSTLFLATLAILFTGCNGSATSGNTELSPSEIVSGSGTTTVPTDWKTVQSDKYSYEMALPAEAIWDEHKVMWPPPGEPNYTFEVAERKSEFSAQQYFDDNRKFLVGLNKLMFKDDTKTESDETQQFGIDHGDGLIQLVKIIVNERFVYTLTATLDQEMLNDSNLQVFFDQFKVSN